MLAAAPTTPPVSATGGGRRRCTLGIKSGKNILYCSSETPAGVSELLFYGRDCGGKPLRRTFVCNPFLRPKRVRKGFFGAFQGDSMHFRGHSRRIALLLPPFVVYYKHRAVLCSICHFRNSYRAENRPVTANRAVFCFCGCVRCTRSFQRICGAIRAQNRPKRAKRGTLGTTKAPGLEGA